MPAADHALSFGAAAEQYARGRPEYPPEALDWIVAPGTADALDLGAGTGKLTRALSDRVATVTAVEPSNGMRAQLAEHVPGATVLAGDAEHIPVADASQDLVTVAQAWHWFDPEPATREIARVLRPGGTLAIVWNIRDQDSTPWTARLGELMHRHGQQDVDTAPELGQPFGHLERAAFEWTRTMTRREVCDMVASRSYVITLADPDRRALMDDVAAHVAAYPDDAIAMPYITYCTRVRR